jgi:hypothetical protein
MTRITRPVAVGLALLISQQALAKGSIALASGLSLP